MALWPQFRSPLVWDVFAVSTYFTVSLMFWYLGVMPDLATRPRQSRTEMETNYLRHRRAGLARFGHSLATPSIGLPVARRSRHAAGALRS